MHHVLIIQRCSTIDEALFYFKRIITEGLSRSALENYLRADLYHTAGAAETNFASNLPEAQSRLAQEMLKGNYDLGFIRRESDNPTLGLLICKDMDRLAFQGNTTPMGVATYDNIKIADISKQLPTPEQIRQQIEIAEEEFRSAHPTGT